MSQGLLRALAGLVLVGDVVLVLIALYLAVELEPTYVAAQRSAKGQAMAVPAALSALTATATMIGSGRRWARPALVVAAALTVVSLLVLVLRQTPDLPY